MSSIARPKMCTNLLNGAKLRFSTSSLQFKSHYDTLGITAKATQSDIKSAYYELTKVYHPDKNSSEEAKEKFRNITDAYETLSNNKSRRMYDRGMRLRPMQPKYRDEEAIRKEEAQTRFYRSRFNRSRIPTPDSRIPIYNFDEWTRAHYGELFNQTVNAKRSNKAKAETNTEDELLISISVVCVFILLGIIIISTNENEYDKNKLNSEQRGSRPS